MTIFQIKQAATGAVLWTGGAADEQQALDAMAREAGYADFAALPESLRGATVDRLNLG
ncbi:hypothetical protein [Methylobacterium isbiliense]|uniref:Uncharacterized protein n=1 Tax=Methylobacterium isbiliense TaxID=315478 RepID=A0ABQ4SCT1_9HYPH|nr:hypothetical protein [Methylobacterium isbiliense]MDN3626115.1 hypothetical protein [Methylobacterium isbiliense]GJE00256.1 hypothetical protein GMJLKIPL_2175 [Methylobacterium isbiliense]